jgi:leader peptidase (prepilin peptidase) / N-methyltransferase
VTATWLGVALTGALIGGLAVPALTRLGLAQLRRSDRRSSVLTWIGAAAGAAAGAASALAPLHWDVAASIPAMLVWSTCLVAAACCDAVTQRIPTPLVRQAGAVTCMLLASGLAVHGDWRRLLLSGVAAVASGLMGLLSWRFAGAGFGDVRLAVLGGLGIGHADLHGLVVAFGAFVLVTVAQSIVTLRQGGDLQTRIPHGPALAVGYLVAATA